VDREVSIRIRSSFEVEGAEEARSATENLREEFRALAQAVDETAARLAERFPQAVGKALEGTQPAAGEAQRFPRAVEQALEAPPPPPNRPGGRTGAPLEGESGEEGQTPRARPGEIEFRGYRGQFWADIARQALQAGDLDVAGMALARGGMAREPEVLLRRLGGELLEARRRVAPPVEENPLAERLTRRVEAMLPTLAAQIASGRLSQAERTLESAEAYLEQVRALQGNTEAIERLKETLGKHRETLEEVRKEQEKRGGEEKPAQQVDAQGALSEVGELILGRALGGAGGLGALAARLARFLGPWGMLALGGAAAVGAVNMAGSAAQEARGEAQAFLDLNRALGLDYSTWGAFLDLGRSGPSSVYRSRAELRDLYYTAREAGEFAAAYGMIAPARAGTEAERAEALFQDTLAGLRFARYTGTEESRVAALLRTAVQAGAVDPGNAEALTAVLFRAVREGTREGVSTAETLQNMERYLQGLLSQGVTATERSTAFYAALLDRLAETGDRALMGEAGARAVGSILEGLTRTGTPGLEVLAFRALGGPSLPTAREVGLTGAEAREYERLREVSPLLAGRFLLEEARSLNPEAVRRLARGFETTFQGRPDLEYLFGTEFLGLSYEQVASIRGQYGSVFRFLQSVPASELEAYLKTRPEDVATGGEARRMAEAGYQRQLLEEEERRLKSLIAAQQDLDVGLKRLTESVANAAATLASLSKGLEQDPNFGPILRQGRATYERIEREYQDVQKQYRTQREARRPRPGPNFVRELEQRAARDSAINRALRQMGVSRITLPPGKPYDPAMRQRLLSQGKKIPPVHTGLDVTYGGPGPGDPIKAPFEATVKKVDYDATGYGRYVVLEAGGYEVLVGHMQEVRVNPGQTVRPGQVLGLEGQTGAATGPHAHWEIRKGGKPVLDENEFWDILLKLMSPEGGQGGKPTSSLQIGGTLTVQVQGVPPEVGERVARRVEEVVRGELTRWGEENPSPWNEGRRRGRFT